MHSDCILPWSTFCMSSKGNECLFIHHHLAFIVFIETQNNVIFIFSDQM